MYNLLDLILNVLHWLVPYVNCHIVSYWVLRLYGQTILPQRQPRDVLGCYKCTLIIMLMMIIGKFEFTNLNMERQSISVTHRQIRLSLDMSATHTIIGLGD